MTPPADALSATTGLEVQDAFSSTGVTQRVPWGGGTWNVSWEATRTTTNSPISSFDPSLQSGVQVAFSQPLLRDRAIDVSRRQYVVARRDRDSSELRFHESLVQTIAGVKQAYWTLKAAIANVGVQQRSLELAQELARQSRIRVDAGQIPPVDLVQAACRSRAAPRERDPGQREAGDAQDRPPLIMDRADAAFWAKALI